MDNNKKNIISIKSLIDDIIEKNESRIVSKRLSFQIDNKIDKKYTNIIIDCSLLVSLISNFIDYTLLSTNSGFIKLFFEITNKYFVVGISNSGRDIYKLDNNNILQLSDFELIQNNNILPVTFQNIQLKIEQLNAHIEYKISNQHTPLLKISIPYSLADNYVENHNFEKKKIMIVDDELLNVILMEEFVKELDCKVTKAFNGLEAFENASKEDFDAIIMDFKMPKMNGIDSSEKIFEIKPYIPIIIVSAYFYEVEEQAKTNNIKRVIPKPVRQKELLETLKLVIN